MKKKLKALAGFTLAELLIVVAIIAVLVAISIPIFSSKLEASRESTDAANLRSAYAAAATAMLTEKDDTGAEFDLLDTGEAAFYYTKQGKLKLLVEDATPGDDAMTGKSIVDGWQGSEINDLPDGVYLQCSEETDEAPNGTGTDLGNSQRGKICVLMNNNPGSGEHEIEVFFYKAATTGG